MARIRWVLTGTGGRYQLADTKNLGTGSAVGDPTMPNNSAWRVSAMVVGVMLVLGGGCDRAKRAAEETAEAAADQGRAVLNRRSEQQFRDAVRTLQDVAARADVTTLYRVANELDPDYAAVATPRRARVAGYPIREQVAITREEAQSLVSVLTRRQTYFPPGDGWTSMFQPHEVLSVAAGQEVVTVVICTECGLVELIVGGESIGTRSVLEEPNAEIARMLKAMLPASAERPAG